MLVAPPMATMCSAPGPMASPCRQASTSSAAWSLPPSTSTTFRAWRITARSTLTPATSSTSVAWLVAVMRRGRGRRNRGGVWRRAGPDQQNRARGVVHHEPGGLAQALGPEPGPVTVPGHDEKTGALRRGHHLLFGPALALGPLA